MDGLMRRCFLRVEILDQGGKGVEVGSCRVPADDDLLGMHFMVEIVHCAVVLHVDGNLLAGLAVQDSERRPHLDFSVVARAQERP